MIWKNWKKKNHNQLKIQHQKRRKRRKVKLRKKSEELWMKKNQFIDFEIKNIRIRYILIKNVFFYNFCVKLTIYFFIYIPIININKPYLYLYNL